MTQDDPIEDVAPESIAADDTEEADEDGVEVSRRQRHDNLSDLFEVPRPTDDDMYVDDLVTVDVERDIVDGDLRDVTEVTREEIIGNDLGQTPLRSRHARSRPRRLQRTARPYPPPPSLRGTV